MNFIECRQEQWVGSRGSDRMGKRHIIVHKSAETPAAALASREPKCTACPQLGCVDHQVWSCSRQFLKPHATKDERV
ncbi:hypothetical protein GCM10008965_32590 [Methylorubrum aminovorans]|nr:hypothetical protein GCM10025880_67520 [Methylorubrum aminovorans]GMA80386.1 hypothetical protein GCM10025880_68030 [Methylorubrum aminovorans]